MNVSQILASLAFAILSLAAAVQVVGLFRKAPAPGRLSPWLLASAASLLLGSLALRSLHIGFPALTGTYESLLFYAAAVAALAGAWRWQKALPYSRGVAFGATMAAIAIVPLASSPAFPKEAAPPVPALRSGWLALHVGLALVGEAFFLTGFIASAMFLWSRDGARRTELDRVSWIAISIGYVFFTIGALAFGAIWAERAWGRWWSWDPKEIWALVTWLVYTAYLHVRLIRRRNGALPALISVAGFACTAFTFFGVNYLLPGLHSYG